MNIGDLLTSPLSSRIKTKCIECIGLTSLQVNSLKLIIIKLFPVKLKHKKIQKNATSLIFKILFIFITFEQDEPKWVSEYCWSKVINNFIKEIHWKSWKSVVLDFLTKKVSNFDYLFKYLNPNMKTPSFRIKLNSLTNDRHSHDADNDSNHITWV